MWIRLVYSPIKLSSLIIELTNSTKLASVEFTLTETRNKMLNKDHLPCRDYQAVDGYEDCAHTFISSQLSQTVSCSITGQLKKPKPR